MPCHESIADAKATFVSAVSEGIVTLMQQCGYSRERATNALMRELNRGGDHTRPTDKEVSQFHGVLYHEEGCRWNSAFDREKLYYGHRFAPLPWSKATFHEYCTSASRTKDSRNHSKNSFRQIN